MAAGAGSSLKPAEPTKKNADKFSEVVQSVGRQFESADQKKTTWPFLPSGREGKQKHADA